MSSDKEPGPQAASRNGQTGSAEVIQLPLDPQVRLRASLRMLQTRLEQQQESMQAWRDSLLRLGTSLRELSREAQLCHDRFAAIGTTAPSAEITAAAAPSAG